MPSQIVGAFFKYSLKMNNTSNNTVDIISDLLGTIQNFDASNLIAPKDSIAPSYATELGIRSLIFNAMSNGLTLSGQHFTIPDSQDISRYKWHRYKNGMIIDDLKTLFTSCHVISFADWSDIFGASDLWDGLLRDIIKPLPKKQFEFIFYLGDPTKRSVQEVDEILDIISDFSNYGRVTFVLNEEEACKLWMIEVKNGHCLYICLNNSRP